VYFHTDAAQAVGHIPIDVDKMNVDLMSISAHKMYGPKGIGCLYIRSINPRVKPESILHGGGQERKIRSGTLNVPGIVGLGKAIEIASKEMTKENERFVKWTIRMLKAFEKVNGQLNGHPTKRLSHNLNVYFKDIESKAIINSISKKIAISSGSACTTKDVEASHVIMALGFTEERAHSSIRLGLGRFNTSTEINYATDEIISSINNLMKIVS
jgi:cysteine desulfurase